MEGVVSGEWEIVGSGREWGWGVVSGRRGEEESERERAVYCTPSTIQMSDTVERYFGHYYSDSEVGKAVSLEFALFITAFVCALGVAAFLALTLTVEADRRVSITCCSHTHSLYSYALAHMLSFTNSHCHTLT